jgi:hypothetical protein
METCCNVSEAYVAWRPCRSTATLAIFVYLYLKYSGTKENKLSLLHNTLFALEGVL